MYFQYDTNGTPLGFIYNDVQYFYITNQSGDVIAVTDKNGDAIGEYEYDEWGNILRAIGTSKSNQAVLNANPLRYRGYYYDTETGYYYLQSRYYDSSICRFINADDYNYIDKNMAVGINIFAYCCNNSINFDDSEGTSSNSNIIYVFYYSSLYEQASKSVYYNYRSKNVKAYKTDTIKAFVDAWNKMKNPYRVFLYLHGGSGELYFKNESIKSSNLYKKCNQISVKNGIYLFSCKGGAGSDKNKVANVFTRLAGTYVYALPVGVSYGYCGATLERYAKVEMKYYFLKMPNTYWHKYTAKYSKKKWSYSDKNLKKKELLY